MTGDVAGDRFDLDDLGTEGRQVPGAEGRGRELPELDDPDAVERQGGAACAGGCGRTGGNIAGARGPHRIGDG